LGIGFLVQGGTHTSDERSVSEGEESWRVSGGKRKGGVGKRDFY